MMKTCESCHSTNLRTVDGLFYCEDCGTQNRALREFESELDQWGGFSSILKNPRRKQDKESKKKEEVDEVITDDQVTHRILPNIDYPDYLRCVGERLTVATYLIVKISTALHKEFNLPYGIIDRSLSLFQMYLFSMNVAFIAEEVAKSDDNAHVVELKKTLAELEVDRKSQINDLKDKRRKTLELERSQLPVWQQSFLEQTQVEEEDVNEDHLINLEVVKSVNTGLSKASYKMGNLISLSIDTLLSIVYLASQHVGCSWILLSDLHRWHREDRFKVPSQYIYKLGICYVYKGQLYNSEEFFRERRTNLPASSASQFYRPLSFFMQVVRIPTTLYLPSIEKVIHRLVFDLNLPSCFWKRLTFVLNFLPPVTNSYDVRKLQDACEFLTGDELMNRFLNTVDTRLKSAKKLYTFDDSSFFARMNVQNLNVIAILPIETKAAAIILFTMKLMFGLDDSTEYEIDQLIADTTDKKDSFQFVDWLYQLEFRTSARSGISVENILSPTFNSESSGVVDQLLSRLTIPGRMHSLQTNAAIYPNRLYCADTDKPLHKCFPADCANKDGFDSNLAKYAPLRCFGKHALKIGISTPNIDQRRLEIYLHAFNKTQMNYPLINSLGPSELIDELKFCDSECRRQFPALCKFKKRKMHLKFDFLMHRFRDESRTFSETFSRLLSAMSVLVSEKIEVLYLAFSMVESMFLDSKLVKMSSNASSDSSLNLTASDALNTLPQFDDEYAELLSDLPDINVDDDLQEEDSDSMDDGSIDNEEEEARKIKNIKNYVLVPIESSFVKFVTRRYW